MYTPITTPAARDRAELAAKILLGIEIAFGTLAFWSDAIEAGTWKHLVVAFLLTAGFGAVSVLASTIVSRFAEADGHKLTRAMVGFAGFVLVVVSGGMTWHGLAWANDVAVLVSAGFELTLPVAAYGLSALNVIALYTFTREINRRPAAQLVALPDPVSQAAKLMAQTRHANANR
jgi:uncharacterized membrane protein